MRSLLLLLTILTLAACTSAGDPSKNDEVENNNENNVNTEENTSEEYEFTNDISSYTKDDRFIPMDGHISQMIERDDTIADNEHFTINAVRTIKMVDDFQLFQVQMINTGEHEATFEITKAEIDGKDVTDKIQLDYNRDVTITPNEIKNLTIYIRQSKEENQAYDQLKATIKVTTYDEEADLHEEAGEYEAIFEY